MAADKSWREVRGQRALNEARVETYKRVMDAQQQIAEQLSARGVSDEQIERALEAAHPAQPAGTEEDVYLHALARFVGALGGRLEIRAVFPDVTVTLRDPPGADGPSE